MSFDNATLGELLSTNDTSYGNKSSMQQKTGSVCTGGFHWPIHGPLIFYFLLILAANCIVIILTIWKEALRTLSNMFLFSLAISDLLFGLLGIPLFLACSIKRFLLQCALSVLIVRFNAISSVFHLLVIACDRYAIILHSMKYPSLVTKSRAIGVIVFIWVVALVSSTIQFTWYNLNNELTMLKEKTIRIDRVYFLLIIIAFFFVPLLLMVYMYSHVLAVSFRHITAFRRRRKNLDQPVASIAHDMRGTFILVTMMIIFISCWLPFFLLMLQDHVSEQFLVIPAWGLCVIFYLRFIPPLANPVLCAFCKQDYRRAWGAFTRQLHWPTRARFNSLPLVSVTRERTQTAVTFTERSNNGRGSSASLNAIPVEAL